MVFGALDYARRSIRHTLSARKGEDAFMTFLDELLHRFPTNETVVVVLDNVGYHKSHALREWWRTHAAQLQPFFLPAYSPELNLIERLWRYLKGKLACHRWWNDLARLQQATETLLDRARQSISMPPTDQRSDQSTTFANLCLVLQLQLVE